MGYSYLDLAYDVLKVSTKPLIYQEIWEVGREMGLAAKIATSGKTPWQTLGSRLYVDVRDNEESKFKGVGRRPVRFFLKERAAELPLDVLSTLEDESPKAENKTPYHERDLHPLLTYFAYTAFKPGKAIVTKTILHEKSAKSGYNEWIHPDMVGFYFPLDDWGAEVMELNRLSDNNSLRLFSFEIKKSLTKGNYRESFFQAVSNSSWAHEGYLVAAEILQDDEFRDELERLAASFGIGIIHLTPADVDASTVLYPARCHEALDWETINKLSGQNPDFMGFLRDVKIDFESRRVHRSEFDRVEQDIAQYVNARLHIDPGNNNTDGTASAPGKRKK